MTEPRPGSGEPGIPLIDPFIDPLSQVDPGLSNDCRSGTSAASAKGSRLDEPHLSILSHAVLGSDDGKAKLAPPPVVVSLASKYTAKARLPILDPSVHASIRAQGPQKRAPRAARTARCADAEASADLTLPAFDERKARATEGGGSEWVGTSERRKGQLAVLPLVLERDLLQLRVAREQGGLHRGVVP